MTVTEMKSWFNILQDKYGSTYYTDGEISQFFQRAQIEFISKMLPGGRMVENLELSQDSISKISPLIYELPFQNMSSTGVVTKANLQSALTVLNNTALLWRPLSIGWVLNGQYRPVKFVRHNDRWEFAVNFFKKPSLTNPKVRETYNSYIVEPTNIGAKLYFTLLKYPNKVDIAGAVNSDLPDFTHDEIVSIALELTGIASRDTALAQLLQLKNNG